MLTWTPSGWTVPDGAVLRTRIRVSEFPYLRPVLAWCMAVALLDGFWQMAGHWPLYSRPRLVLACAVAAVALPAMMLLVPRGTRDRGVVAAVFVVGLLTVEATMLVATSDAATFGTANWAPGTLGILSLALLARRPVMTVLTLTGVHALVILGGALVRPGPTPTDLAAAGILVVAASLTPVAGGSLLARHVHQLHLRATTLGFVDAARSQERVLEREGVEHRDLVERLRAEALDLIGSVARGDQALPLSAIQAERAEDLSARLRVELVHQRRRSWLTALEDELAPCTLWVADPRDRLGDLPAAERTALYRLVVLLADLLVDPDGSITVAVDRSIIISAEPIREAAGTVARAIADLAEDAAIPQWDLRDASLLIVLRAPTGWQP